MEEQTVGLILRTRPLTETSLIVHWLTRDAGRVATVAKGARRPKSAFSGKLDLLFLASLSFQRSHRGDLHALREVSVQNFHPRLRLRLGTLQQAAYFTQLIEQATEPDTPIPGVYELMTRLLDVLPDQQLRPVTVLAFESKLLAELGLQPGAEAGNLSAGSREILSKCSNLDWPLIARLHLSSAQIRELGHFLGSFMELHLGRVPAGRTVAIEVLSS